MILRFHEDLQHLFPASVNVEASTPLDALKLLAVQHPENGKIKPVPVRIKQLHTMAELNDPTNADDKHVFDIVPVAAHEVSPTTYHGAGGGGGWVNIVIGVVLVVVAIVAPYLAPALYTGAYASIAGAATTMVMSMGFGMMISGIMQLLAPTPKVNENKDGNLSSRTFGARTTSEIGTPIQIVFGTYKIGFHLFSFNVESRKYSGIDDPINSPYFKGKVDENLPTQNLNKYYGFIQAGDKAMLNQVDNGMYRTGSEF
ncbi:tail assembly protein [Acinetobacter phage EAb13]|nr:tail assembly protein [Acinetobacter phage EAb13]